MDQVPPGGYSLIEAFRALLPEARHRMLTALMLSKSLQGPGEAAEVIRLRGILWAELSSRLQAGTLAATGFSYAATIPAPIHPAFFNNAVPDYDKDAVSMNGATFDGVRILAASAVQTGPRVVPASSASDAKGSGGAPPRYPWADFIVEIVRFAHLNGIETRAELTKHMREWVTSQWDPSPDENTVRRKVKEFCPPEIRQN